MGEWVNGLNRSTPVTSVHHMVDRPRVMDAQFSCHRSTPSTNRLNMSIPLTDPILTRYEIEGCSQLTHCPDYRDWSRGRRNSLLQSTTNSIAPGQTSAFDCAEKPRFHQFCSS